MRRCFLWLKTAGLGLPPKRCFWQLLDEGSDLLKADVLTDRLQSAWSSKVHDDCGREVGEEAAPNGSITTNHTH